MRTNRYQSYFEEELREANPIKLVVILYRGALDAIASARRFVRLGEIRSRARAVNEAIGILGELTRSLDQERGGDLSRNLARLYAYIRGLLIRANSEQSEAPLEQAERLLNTLLGAWIACMPAEPAPDLRSRMVESLGAREDFDHAVSCGSAASVEC
jgi:flagellar protein FliS